MTDYISRAAAISYIKDNQCKRCSDIGLCGKCAVLTAVKLFESIPAADVRPVVRGKWQYNLGYNIPYCSVCTMPQDSECNFCPSCGADMREPPKEETE